MSRGTRVYARRSHSYGERIKKKKKKAEAEQHVRK